MAVDDVATLILRFRDLTTPPGQTVARHNDIAAEHGYVWWGWWHKAGEKVPLEIFGNLKNRATTGDTPLEIYLFDSGQNLLYRTTCQDIDFSTANERESSPNRDLTPDYYSEQKYLAWYKLGTISEITEEPRTVLRNLTYVRVDEFFESRSSRYDPFYGKRIASPQELRQQDRTIWFVREATTTDPSHEIELLDAKRFHPRHFPTEFRQKTSRKILWLSDLHFSTGDHHRFPLQNRPDLKTLAHQLEQAMETFEGKSLGGMIISGDFTWRADAEEFRHSYSFINECRSWSKLDAYDFMICPGNHDLAFSPDPAEKDRPVDVASDEATRNYREFYNNLFYQHPNEYLASGRRFLLGNAVPIEIVGLNSSLLQQDADHFQGHGFLGDDQLRFVRSKMEWGETIGTRPLRIAVLHHHVLPVPYRQEAIRGRIYSTVLDAEALIRWAYDCQLDFILHGHMHQPFFSQLSRPRHFGGDEYRTIGVIGMGSSGVSRNHLGNVGQNLCAVLEVAGDKVDIRFYQISPRGEATPYREFSLPLPLRTR